MGDGVSTNDGGPAFPIIGEGADGLPMKILGISIRDYFAATALAGAMANTEYLTSMSLVAKDVGRARTQVLAQITYEIADDMLAERAKGKP